ncbi:type III secretion system gatekeeper subunit SctW [Vibrio mangrovi]|uniref:HrpJ-like domain protein n=1 Tax=Vibrio mangrovi TaxID=474394 RepID=A0A1Y6J1B4_9VIBR|nr:type III secretion system gatekeeper subunit SctW [Vibrio mangrovi]MDW6001960.1 type III secretion system gatekeeper subunit SctW [Vibrio mangrovi]SMS02492.1 HrpJ-like domain protein [Vibrio mangrovi]
MSIHSISNTNSLEALYTPPPTSVAKTAAPHPPMEDMSDAMEEISMKFSESVERNSKSLDERSVKPRMLQRIEKLQALYGMLTSHESGNLDGDIRKLLAMGQQELSLSLLLKMSDGDPAKADILAQHAMHRARAQNQPEKFNQLQKLLQELNQEHGQEVRAGINTAEALALFTQDPQQRQNMRSLYYQNIVGQGSLAAIFDALLSQFDEAHFSQGVHTLIRAMTDDLSSQFPSLPSGQLRAMLRDLTASQQLTGILGGCKEILTKLAAKHILQDMTAPRLTRRLLEFTQSSVYPREIKSLSDDTVGNSPLNHVKFLNSLYPLIQKLPLPVWKDGKARQGTLNLVLRMMTEYAHYEQQHAAQVAAQQTQQSQPVLNPE